MDGRFNSNSPVYEPEDVGISPETSSPSPRSSDLKAVHQFSSNSSPSPKRSRRSVHKKVVTVPISEADSSRPRITGEGAPPSDSWAWRKYGQKPIKGSPYPRGYYRCSSSKGCPARKQVERSSSDPTMLVVTYSCEHNHSWPLPKSHHRSAAVILNTSIPSPVLNEEEPEAVLVVPVSEPAEDKFLIGEELMRDEYYWFSDVGSPSATSTAGSTDDLLLGSIVVSADIAAMSFSAECDELGRWEEEEDSLFAGLGELPECSVVLRRGFVDGRRCGLAASL